jgi:hypothetical protein
MTMLGADRRTDDYKALPDAIPTASPSGRQVVIQFTWADIFGMLDKVNDQASGTVISARWKEIWKEHKLSAITTHDLWIKCHAKCSFEDFQTALGRIYNDIEAQMRDTALERAKWYP